MNDQSKTDPEAMLREWRKSDPSPELQARLDAPLPTRATILGGPIEMRDYDYLRLAVDHEAQLPYGVDFPGGASRAIYLPAGTTLKMMKPGGAATTQEGGTANKTYQLSAKDIELIEDIKRLARMLADRDDRHPPGKKLLEVARDDLRTMTEPIESWSEKHAARRSRSLWLDAWTQAVEATWPDRIPETIFALKRIVRHELPFTPPEILHRPAEAAWRIYEQEGDTPAGRAAVALAYVLLDLRRKQKQAPGDAVA